MRKTLLSLLLLFAAGMSSVHAQRSGTQLGFRATPDGGGLNFRHFFDRNLALEAQLNAGGIFGLEGESLTAVGLIEYHFALPEPSLWLFFGGGAHFGTWTDRNNNGRRNDDDDDFIAGIDGIGGIEYYFKNIPLSLSADFKPALNFVSEVDFFPHNIFGLSARYQLGRRR